MVSCNTNTVELLSVLVFFCHKRLLTYIKSEETIYSKHLVTCIS